MDQEQAYEQQRVNQVTAKIKTQTEHTKELYQVAHQETGQIEKNYTQNAKVNLIEADDRIETHAALQQQKGLVARAVENETILKHQITDLEILAKSPYFGRIDIKDPGESEAESLYIGVSSFADTDGNFLVYDWRAPIASIYYNGTLGQVSYATPSGLMTTDLIKKRQFNIQDGQIIHMFDTNETVGDELLQSALGEHNDEYMRNIVATTQKEQNDIIRDTTSDLLVVQGVAGSGKTSAILQRIAFLLYHSRTSLNADEIILFSPNRLYSRYISDVLPSLGERNMRQITLAEFFNRRFEGLNVQSLFDRFEHPTKSDSKILEWQEGRHYIKAINDYISHLTSDQLQFTDIIWQGETFFSAKLIKQIFDNFPISMTIATRMLKTKNELIKLLKERIDQTIKADWVQEKLNNLSDEQYRSIVGRRHFKSYDAENHFIGTYLVRKEFQIIDNAIYNSYFIDAYSQYVDFMHQVALPTSVTKTTWQAVIQNFKSQLELHNITLEHAAPLLLLRDLLTGSGVNRKFQYVFIDEMQDYSIAQIMYLKHAFPRAKFTLLGDSEQTLFKDVIQPQQLLANLKVALNVKRANLIALNQSYRSTKEITNFGAALLPNGQHIQAFTRSGELPQLMLAKTENKVSALTKLCTDALQKFETVAILTKNMAEAQQIYQLLHRTLNISLLNDGDLSIPKGIIVLPIYLAKGLEFDSVIAYDISQQNYPDDTWRGTVYTMTSRAMHELNILSLGPISKLISNLDTQLFKLSTELNRAELDSSRTN